MTVIRLDGKKKLLAAITGGFVVVLLDLIGYDNKESVEAIKQLAIAYIVGQGLTDIGKSKAIIEG